MYFCEFYCTEGWNHFYCNPGKPFTCGNIRIHLPNILEFPDYVWRQSFICGRGLNVGNFRTGINYPTSPIIRRQRYLKAPPADSATPLRYFGSCEPQTWFGASHSGAWETILGGPEIPQSLWNLSRPRPWSK